MTWRARLHGHCCGQKIVAHPPTLWGSAPTGRDGTGPDDDDGAAAVQEHDGALHSDYILRFLLLAHSGMGRDRCSCVLSCPSRVSFYGKGPGAVSLIGHVLMVLLLRGVHSGEFVCLSA
jgi:hypothetical protein